MGTADEDESDVGTVVAGADYAATISAEQDFQSESGTAVAGDGYEANIQQSGERVAMSGVPTDTAKDTRSGRAGTAPLGSANDIRKPAASVSRKTMAYGVSVFREDRLTSTPPRATPVLAPIPPMPRATTPPATATPTPAPARTQSPQATRTPPARAATPPPFPAALAPTPLAIRTPTPPPIPPTPQPTQADVEVSEAFDPIKLEDSVVPTAPTPSPLVEPAPRSSRRWLKVAAATALGVGFAAIAFVLVSSARDARSSGEPATKSIAQPVANAAATVDPRPLAALASASTTASSPPQAATTPEHAPTAQPTATASPIAETTPVPAAPPPVAAKPVTDSSSTVAVTHAVARQDVARPQPTRAIVAEKHTAPTPKRIPQAPAQPKAAAAQAPAAPCSSLDCL